ncbi:hypothetical protein ACFWBB_30975 [Streptomyces sp. NPDC060000]|uniref:hypothetical protein n=1 Tax=Streptomyces sp. NPDC060000 TaxID=3347031 RepID=UPI003697CFD7
MTLALMAVKPLEELTEQYGPMRTVLHCEAPTAVPRQQQPTYTFNILGGQKLRESLITDANGHADLNIRFVEYIDPVSGWTRYAVDYWSINSYWATDHVHRAVAEAAYEDAVRAEFAEPTLTLSPERRLGGLARFYDVTDVVDAA